MKKKENNIAESSTSDVWEKQARKLIKVELVRQEVSLAQLADRLGKMGVSENAQNLSNKISRGKFSLAFFLKIMDALEVKKIELSGN